jgi:hypothetical protein
MWSLPAEATKLDFQVQASLQMHRGSKSESHLAVMAFLSHCPSPASRAGVKRLLVTIARTWILAVIDSEWQDEVFVVVSAR